MRSPNRPNSSVLARACLLSLLLSCSLGWSQTAQLEPGVQNPQHPSLPTITFTVDWPEIRPQHYAISVESTGRASYTALDDLSDPGEPYMLKFTLSDPMRERIFAAAKALNYFKGDFDYTKHKVAFTGRKTLKYADPVRVSSATYNWSENAQLMDLTRLLMGIANTINSGRQLEHLHRYDRLSLNSELKSMEEAAKSHNLEEIHIIEPILRQLANDPAVMDLARQRARGLLSLAAGESVSAASSR